MINPADLKNTLKHLTYTLAIPKSFAIQAWHDYHTGDLQTTTWQDVADYFDMHGYTTASEYCNNM